MGYILPIQHDSYKDYHNRIIAAKRDPYFIEKPFKAILEPQYEDIENDAKLLSRMVRIKKRGEYDEGKITAILTGKGRQIDQRI